MDNATETLRFPYARGLIDKPVGRLLFLNAVLMPGLPKDAVCVQPRCDKARGLNVRAIEGAFDTVWVLPGKDIEEARHLLATGLAALKEDGVLVAAAANDAGGKRLEGLFGELGLAPQAESKNKARVVYADAEGRDEACVRLWREAGEPRPILGDKDILSQPGLHGWNKIDEGSALLARLLPPLAGHVADFGCGWGYLSLQAAAKGAARLTLIDVDARAVRLAGRNVAAKYPALPVAGVWADLTYQAQAHGPFDAVLLNPPFHSGTRATPELGIAIITTAAKSLKTGGKLHLVANAHLPYEKTLQELFSSVESLAEENGFKVFTCIR